MSTRIIGASFAATAAVFAIASTTTAAPAFAKGGGDAVHCYGVNSCKGTSDCKTAANECKGQNECKGHGFKAMSAKMCAKAGGSTTEPK